MLKVGDRVRYQNDLDPYFSHEGFGTIAEICDTEGPKPIYRVDWDNSGGAVMKDEISGQRWGEGVLVQVRKTRKTQPVSQKAKTGLDRKS